MDIRFSRYFINKNLKIGKTFVKFAREEGAVRFVPFGEHERHASAQENDGFSHRKFCTKSDHLILSFIEATCRIKIDCK